MFSTISLLVSENHFDVAVVSELQTASYWRAFAPLPAIFDNLEIGMFESQALQAPWAWQRWRHQMTQLKQRGYLKRLLPQFGACTVVSDQERELVRQRVPGYEAIEVIPNCVNLADYRDVPTRGNGNALIFTGSFGYRPNHDAMVWFLDEVMPRIQVEVPDVRLTITGDPADRLLPAVEGVTLTGHVEDVRPLIAGAAISVVPLRLGGGTRLKILEAMALGTPVVSTTKGAEGLDVQDGRHLLLADSPADFAAAVVGLFRNPDLGVSLAREARTLISERYDWNVVLPRFLDLVEKVGQRQRLEDRLG